MRPLSADAGNSSKLNQALTLLKLITYSPLGFKSFDEASQTLAGIEILQMIKKEQTGPFY
jgi:hypothetical protein